jgi:hypothetical protein
MIAGIPTPNPTASAMVPSELRLELDGGDDEIAVGGMFRVLVIEALEVGVKTPVDDNAEVGLGVLLGESCEEVVPEEAKILPPAAMN